VLPDVEDADQLAETVAWQLLARWGVVFRDVYLKERLAVPWREILRALRRLEARGLIRGGHFVTGVTGEQFAEETAVALLRPRRGSRHSPIGRPHPPLAELLGRVPADRDGLMAEPLEPLRRLVLRCSFGCSRGRACMVGATGSWEES
jgi:hypothetical protein